MFVDVFSGHWTNNEHDALLSPIPDCGVDIKKRNSHFKDTTDDSFDSTDGLIIGSKNLRTKVPVRRIPTTHGGMFEHGEDDKKTPFLERQEGVKRDVLSKGRSFLLEQQKRHRLEAKRTKEMEMKEKLDKVEKLQALSRKARQLVHETVLLPHSTGAVGHGNGAVKVSDFFLFTIHYDTYSVRPSDPSFLI